MPSINKVQRSEGVFWFSPEMIHFDPTKRMKLLLNVVGDKEWKEIIDNLVKNKKRKSKFSTRAKNSTEKCAKKFQ